MKNTKALILVPAAACTLVAAGCSSGSSDTAAGSAADSATTASSTAQADGAGAATGAMTCPSDPPADDAEPQWQVGGATGSVSIVGQTDTTAPRIDVDAPFSVDETQVRTLDKGEGVEVTGNSTVAVCYVGVDGADGSTFDSAYQRGRPATFPAQGVVPGFRKALVGQTVGSSVAVVMPPEDGYGQQGTPDGSIQGGDSLVFALKILDEK